MRASNPSRASFFLMAKELPYFKFEPSQWDNGNIQLCSFEAQGVFISVCSMYWQRLADLPFKLAVQKICAGNATALQSLCDNDIIKVIDGMISIDFLNEQLSEFENISNKNSENARIGWKKRNKNAVAMRSHSDRNAIREEERRGENVKHNYAFNQKLALISNTPYSLPEERGMNPVGRNVDIIVEMLKTQGFTEGQIYSRTRAMKSIYAKQKLTFPVKVETFIESFTAKDWVKELASMDPEKQAEQFQKNLKDETRTIEPDLIGSSRPGSLG